MGIEIIQNNPDFFSFRPMNFNHLMHTNGKILFGTPGSHFYMPPTSQGFQKHEQVAGSFSPVFVVISNWFSLLKRQWFSSFADQLIRNFVKTDHWIVRLVGFGIQIQNIFHPPDKFSPDDRRNAPFLPHPGLEIVFFSTRRTASYERLSKWVKVTKRSASSCKVQRLRPSGGWLWARVVRMVSTLSSILGKRPARERSLSAKTSPPLTNLRRVRMTVFRLVCNTVPISSSFLPWSASNKIFARLTFRAPGRPFLVSSTNVSFSTWLRSTMYLFTMNISFHRLRFLEMFYVPKFI
jgi:hypothetical protein